MKKSLKILAATVPAILLGVGAGLFAIIGEHHVQKAHINFPVQQGNWGQELQPIVPFSWKGGPFTVVMIDHYVAAPFSQPGSVSIEVVIENNSDSTWWASPEIQ